MKGAKVSGSSWRIHALIGLLLVMSSLALAQHARADEDAEYQDLINRALVEYQGGRWEESRSLFERAHAHKPSARTLRGIALASFEMRDYVRCVIALRGALASEERALDPTQRKQAQDLLAQAEDYVAHRTLALSP